MHIKRINLNCSKQTIKLHLLRPLDYENIQSLFDSKLWLYVVTSIIVKESFTQKLQFAENFLPLKSSKMYNKLVFFFFHQNRFGEMYHHSLTSGSSAVNGCRQNESPNSW